MIVSILLSVLCLFTGLWKFENIGARLCRMRIQVEIARCA